LHGHRSSPAASARIRMQGLLKRMFSYPCGTAGCDGVPVFDPWRFLPRMGLPITAHCPVCRARHAFPVGWSVLAKCGALAFAGIVPWGVVDAYFSDSFAAFLLALLATVLLFPVGAWIASVICFGLGMRMAVERGRKA